MIHRPRRAFLGFLCALACAALLPSAAGAVIVGIGDQSPAMFSDQRFLALHITEARVGVSWNVAIGHPLELQAARVWLRAAADAGVTPLVTFAGSGNYIPTVAQYTRAVRAFIRDFPRVTRYTPWNEPDWVYSSLSQKPGLAAAYFNALVRSCRGCLILAGDLYLPAGQLGPWLRAYRRGLRYHPAGWALHNYYDVRTHTARQLRVMLSLTRGPIWVDESSGVLRRGHWQFRNQSAAAAARDERFLFSLPTRFPRITRIYHYQWQAPPLDWDSGLIAVNGRPRPGYQVVAAAAG